MQYIELSLSYSLTGSCGSFYVVSDVFRTLHWPLQAFEYLDNIPPFLNLLSIYSALFVWDSRIG